MKQKTRFLPWEIAGFVFSVIVGGLWHNLYAWSGFNSFVGVFAPVNESTWEHLKILFFPGLIFAIIEYIFIGKNMNSFLASKSLGILLGMLTIVTFFYTYKGVIGREYDVINIVAFILGGIVTYAFGYNYSKKASKSTFDKVMGAIILLTFIVVFVVFTFVPPDLAIFIN